MVIEKAAKKAFDRWINDRIRKGYSFLYHKGFLSGGEWANKYIQCIETGESTEIIHEP